MAAQSGKHFKETLCESRAHPVDSPDPTAAKTIDELKRQVAHYRAEIESERSKFRELQWSHERDVRSIREDAEKKLDRSLEVLSRRKDNERLVEVEQVKERLLKQNQQELRSQRVELEEEMKRLERRLTKEREESMRKVLDLERKKTEEELSHYLPEDSVMSREEHLKAEIFRLGVEVERLEFQVSNLQRENREQINLIKKTNQEHKMEVENVKKKNQAEAARDLAQLKLAEQIIQEKDRHIQEEEYRVDMALMEKEALVEELAGVQSKKTLESLARDEAVQSPTSGKRLSMAGGGILQRRVDELESVVKKLDEERRLLKQENASLRKAAVKEGGGGEGDVKAAEEKLKRLRKRNAELVALARMLDDKIKSLKVENEQLKASGGVASSVTVGVGGGGEKGKGGGGEMDGGRKMSLSRQHAKDISEYTRQLLTKDRELESLRIRLAKYEVNGKARYEPVPEMEKRVRSMAMERLRMEKVMVQLYSKVSNPLDVSGVTRQEMADESQEMERVFDENKSLREELELLKSQTRMEDVDHVPPSPLTKQRSVPAIGSRGGGSEREKLLAEENSTLQVRVATLEKCETEVERLQGVLKETESARTSYEQQNRRLTQQLKQTQQLAKEMDAVQEMCVDLEKQVTEFNGQISERDSRMLQLEKNYQRSTESLHDARQEADTLRGKVEELEVSLRGKQDQIKQLASELDQQPPPSHPPPPPSSSSACDDIPLQTSLPEKPTPSSDPISVPPPPPSTSEPIVPAPSGTTSSRGVKNITSEQRVKSAGRSRRVKSPVKRAGSRDQADVSLDNEMRLVGVEMTDSYDSSEGIGFSDTNLDGSSALLSLDEEGGGRREGGGEGGRGISESPHLAWVEEERLPASDDGSEGHGERGRAVGGEEVGSGSHDITSGSGDPVDEGGVGESGEGREGEGEGEGGLQVTDLEALAKPEELVSSSGSSDTDLTLTHNRPDDQPEPPHEPDTTTNSTGAPPPPPPVSSAGDHSSSSPATGSVGDQSTVSVFIAKYSYNPAQMSPNPNYEQELAVTVGDYLFIFGDMDTDGFYLAQRQTGETGLVPSNFVLKVEDAEGDPSVPRPTRSSIRRVSDLQDIPELDENDVSSSSVSTTSDGRVPPPVKLELNSQYVEDDKYCVVIQWSSPPSLVHPSPSPPSSSSSSSQPPHQVTYHIYVNQELKQAAGGVSGAMATQLNDIPRHQLVKISVRTVTEEGESPDPKKIIILNPQYPEPPTRVQVSLMEEEEDEEPAILVEWAPGRVLEAGAHISGYVVLVNGSTVTQLVCSSRTATPGEVLCAKLQASHLSKLSLLPEDRLLLSVRSVSDQYQSLDSAPVVLPRELFERVVGSNRSSREELQSSVALVGSGGEGRGDYSSQSMRAEDHMTSHVTSDSSHVTQSGGHVTTNGPQLNGSMNGDSEQRDEIDGTREIIKGQPRYYIANFSYNPTFHSPNEETVDDELAFREGDIIAACTEVDEEGFFEGVLRGKRGLIPSNMVEQITDSEQLANIEHLIAEQDSRSPDPLSRLPTVNGGDPLPVNATRKMRALFGYSPATDSPNENKDEELCIEEGDVVTVFGRPDDDGYYQGELKGKKGLVPSNFLEEYKEEEEGERERRKSKRKSSGGLGMEIFAASEQDMEEAKRIIAEASDSLKRSGSLSSSVDNSKHKKGIFAKGKELFSKSGGKK